MNKAELVAQISSELRSKNIKKPVFAQRHVFHISDDEGHKKDFVLKETDRRVYYTADDVDVILETALSVILDALRNGDKVTVRGFGSLFLAYRRFGKKRDISSGEFIDMPSRYVPKFVPGHDLRRCAQLISQLNDEEKYLKENGDTIFEEDSGGEE